MKGTDRRIGSKVRVLWIVVLLIMAPSIRAYGQKSITASFTSTSGAFTALWVAQESQSFAKYGVNVTLAYIAGGSKAVAVLLAGEAPITMSSGESLVRARLNGGSVVAIATPTYTFVASLMVAPEIKTAADLKGKTLGISRFGTTPHLGTLIALQRLGLNPNTDVAIRQMGGIPEAFAAMQSRQIQGGYLPAPLNLQVQKRGFHALVDLGTLNIPYDQSLLLASQKLIQRDRSLVLDFLKGYVAGIARSKRDKAFTKSVMSKYTRVKDDEILEYSYKIFIETYLNKAPVPHPEAIQTVLDFLREQEPKARQAKPEEFIDASLVKQLEDSGFIASLY